MGFAAGFSGVITQHALIALLVVGALVILNFAAGAKIIGQSGFSWWWVILPFLPFALTIANFITLWNRTHQFALGGTFGFVGLNYAGVGVVFRADEGALLLSWAAFLIFAFIRWPVSGEHDEVEERAHRRSFRRRVDAAAEMPIEAGRVRENVKQPRAARSREKVGAVAAASSPAPRRSSTPAIKHCVWCGDPLPGSRALFHDCGDKDAPPVFCAKCGSALSEDSDDCLQCA
jgi:hypothetical protein